jgi:predicted esterase
VSENLAAPTFLPHAHHLRVERTARYYTLGAEGWSADARAIWFVLHGYGQLAGTFVRFFADIAKAGALVVAPEALNRFYLVSPEHAPARERPVGATWMTREDRESEVSDYVEYLDALRDEIIGEPAVPVNVLGFSQGAATATRWVLNGRARIEHLVLWGGLMPPDVDLARGLVRLRDTRVTLVAGTRDHYITEEILAAERARLEAAGVRCEFVRFNGGHVISRSAFPQVFGVVSDASDR